MNFKIISDDTFKRKKINSLTIIRCLASLINSLLGQALLETTVTSKVTLDLTLVQDLKMIRIEDQHRQNSKIKSEMKAKVKLVEDKSKHKFVTPKGKKSKKSNHSSSSNLLNLPPLNPKLLARGLVEDSATSAGESFTWHLNVSTGRRNQSKLNQEETKEMAGTTSTW